MNRPTSRQVVAVLLVCLALGGITAGVRIADVGAPYPAGETTVDTDQPPREVVQQSGRLLNVLDHRLVTRVYVVDDTGDRDLHAEYTHLREFSEKQHLAVYDTYATPGRSDPVNRSTQFHSFGAFLHAGILERPGRTVIYHTDGGFVSEVGVGADANATVYGPDSNAPPRFVDPNRAADVARENVRELYGDVFVPHDASWRVADRSNGTRTYVIDEADQHFETRPIPFGAELLDGSRISVTVDAETGRLRTIRERRVLRYDVPPREAGETFGQETVEYEVETRVDQYGTAEVRQPAGASPTLQQLLADLLHY
ncbi:hypothetical protein N0B31_02980 [Salinirubellus salinus]|uniref:Uncharacterized protein n=1 Tax=Salinirubellus salinus TaxID=1364945 RepID=A0A9E7R4W3_9EURY|nr:hypothetical protein [Salinirubellus salinus]UWM55254.1 hypothetical protein N0B31_02980 [Salinirubellus salinus]